MKKWMNTAVSEEISLTGVSAGNVPQVTPRKLVCSQILNISDFFPPTDKTTRWGLEEAGCSLPARAAGSCWKLGGCKGAKKIFDTQIFVDWGLI